MKKALIIAAPTLFILYAAYENGGKPLPPIEHKADPAIGAEVAARTWLERNYLDFELRDVDTLATGDCWSVKGSFTASNRYGGKDLWHFILQVEEKPGGWRIADKQIWSRPGT